MAAAFRVHVRSHVPTSAAGQLLHFLWLQTLMTAHPKQRDTIFHAISLANGCIYTATFRGLFPGATCDTHPDAHSLNHTMLLMKQAPLGEFLLAWRCKLIGEMKGLKKAYNEGQ